MTLYGIAFGLFALALVVRIAGACARISFWRQASADKLRAEFFDAAQQLISDDRVPDQIVDFVATMAELIKKPMVLRRFAFHLLTNRVKRKLEPSLEKAMRRMDAAQMGLFAKAVVTFAVAVTFNNVVLGIIFRRMFWVVQASNPKPSIEDNRVKALTSDIAAAHC